MNRALRAIFPYIITILLWAVPHRILNPFGSLALIPIFYYMFGSPRKHWFWFGIAMCFLLDFNADTRILFTILFLLSNALNGIYGIFDFDGESGLNAKSFCLFAGILWLFMAAYALIAADGFFMFAVGALWLCAWIMVLYLPFAALFRKIDR
jgi:hypothetical protein